MGVTAKVLLADGPLEGKVVLYGHPLPPILVVATREPIRWHDYAQQGDQNVYRHSSACPTCERDEPVELDTVLCW